MEVTRATSGIDDVDRVEPPAHADLEHDRIEPRGLEDQQRRQRVELEERERVRRRAQRRCARMRRSAMRPTPRGRRSSMRSL